MSRLIWIDTLCPITLDLSISLLKHIFIFSSHERSSGRAIALPPAWVAASEFPKCFKVFMLKFFDVMGNALTGELSCPVTGFAVACFFCALKFDSYAGNNRVVISKLSLYHV